MELNLDPKKMEAEIVRQAVDQLFGEDEGEAYSRYLDGIRTNINTRIDKLFADHADKLIQDALNTAIKDGFNREYSKVNQWGKREEAGATTIAKELERLISSYWAERLDSNGKPTDSTYGTTLTRAEYLMTQICADDFTAAMKNSVLSVTGALKDGMRNQLAKQMDQTLNGLFKIKSLQDQGKVEKPY